MDFAQSDFDAVMRESRDLLRRLLCGDFLPPAPGPDDEPSIEVQFTKADMLIQKLWGPPN